MNRITNLNEYKILQTVSFAYISIPTILFVLGWIKPVYSIPLTILILAGLFLSVKKGWNFTYIANESKTIKEKQPPQNKPIANNPKNKNVKVNTKAAQVTVKKDKKDELSFFRFLDNPVVFYSLALLLVIIAVLYSGVGGFAIQDGDYVKHNSFFLDLTKYSWPLAFEKTGLDDAPRILNTYLAYYLPSALVGKIFGFSAGYFFSFIWVCLGLFLTFIWISQFMSKRSVLYLILFIIFGELAYFSWAKYFPQFSMYGKSYNYANWMLYYSMQSPILKGVFWILGSNHTAIANAVHHIFPSWICILMIFHDSVYRKSLDRLGFIYSFVPFVSAFLAIGLAPFILLSVIQNKFKNVFTIQNYLVAPILVVVAGLFLTSNPALFIKGWVWEFIKLGDAWPYLIRFFVFSIGIYFLLMPKKKSNFHDKAMLPWLYTSIACIVLFSFYRIGQYMDFPIKAYNPSWIIFQVCLIASISYSKTFVEKMRSAILILLLFIAGIGAFSNIKYAETSKLFTHDIVEDSITHVNNLPKAQYIVFFSDGKSFFWEELAKKPIYTKN
jgi:hypothetical protein